MSASNLGINVGIIGGSGFYSLLNNSSEKDALQISTPYSTSPVSVYIEHLPEGQLIYFIPRHGKDHAVPPHRINYRANLWALKEAGASNIIAVNAVGGLSSEMAPGQVVIPDQIIDYTWGREHTFFDGLNSLDNHIDFSWPYTEKLTSILSLAAQKLGITTINSGVYACTQGPRLETSAEVIRLRNDGSDIVGMTGMPEAALARELELSYACLSIVVNWGAGLTDREITMNEIQGVLDSGLEQIRKILIQSIGMI